MSCITLLYISSIKLNILLYKDVSLERQVQYLITAAYEYWWMNVVNKLALLTAFCYKRDFCMADCLIAVTAWAI